MDFEHHSSPPPLVDAGPSANGAPPKVPHDHQAAEPAAPLRGGEMQPKAEELPAGPSGRGAVPKLTIVILVVGTRGDVQPFIALGQKLALSHGHNVRLATNRMYGSFVESCGLQFYPLGGDPELLSSLMVKNHGMVPSSVAETRASRGEYRKILMTTWQACTAPDPHTGAPFSPDIIIANPPASGHIHCAEKLGVPLHMMFTMPWSPTTEFPHPFSPFMYRYQKQTRLNYYSYHLMECAITYGVHDIINQFRREVLALDPLAVVDRPAMMLHRLQLPFSYAWSPSLAPKPKDWGPRVDVVGFMYLQGPEEEYQPPAKMAAFLAAGPPPVYIGFGSMSVQDPSALTRVIFSALEKTGQRAVVARGWAHVGEGSPPPPNVLLVGNVPHRWLFPRCSAVVHHGGAGTVAAGLEAGRPTLVVPFFGDQHIWGQLVAAQGLGPQPIEVRQLSQMRLVSALQFMCRPEVKSAAADIAKSLKREHGVEGALASFYRHLPLRSLACDLCPSLTAKVRCQECELQLSPLADEVIHPKRGPQGGMGGHARRRHMAVDWGAVLYAQPWHSLVMECSSVFHNTGVAGALLDPYRNRASGGVSVAFRGSAIGAVEALWLPLTSFRVLARHLGATFLQQEAGAAADLAGRAGGAWRGSSGGGSGCGSGTCPCGKRPQGDGGETRLPNGGQYTNGGASDHKRRSPPHNGEVAEGDSSGRAPGGGLQSWRRRAAAAAGQLLLGLGRALQPPVFLIEDGWQRESLHQPYFGGTAAVPHGAGLDFLPRNECTPPSVLQERAVSLNEASESKQAYAKHLSILRAREARSLELGGGGGGGSGGERDGDIWQRYWQLRRERCDCSRAAATG